MTATQLAALRRARTPSQLESAPHRSPRLSDGVVLTPPGVSRRTVVRTAAGAAVSGGLWQPLLNAHGISNPVPIPIGSFGFHVNAPGLLDPVDADPSSITDFHGFVGLAFISGTVTRTNRRTREEVDLPFLVSDMRFMQGTYRGFDGVIRRGTFGFI